MRVSKAQVKKLTLPLIIPYELSFTTVREITPVFILLELENGERGIGEATALQGYGDENHEDIYQTLSHAAAQIISSDEEEIRSVVDEMFLHHPFSASAIGTAVDIAFKRYLIPQSVCCPVLLPLSSGISGASLVKKLEEIVVSGCRTVKVKIGKNIDQDLRFVHALFELPFDVKFRFDANQGYTLDEAYRFIETIENLNPKNVELIEQPFGKNQWELMEKLCKQSSIPLMLDESIYHQDDISRASEIGARFIKLKLFKTKGPGDLIEKARYARSLGLKVVLGNGVASDIANLIEAIAFFSNPEIFYGAFEGNGFVKSKFSFLKNTLTFRQGNAIWQTKGSVFQNVNLDFGNGWQTH